jgi:Ni2+-binding GTPase involved in maturation of urease and hydrogenase
MKNLKIVITILILSLSTLVFATHKLDIPPKIFDAIKVGNVSELVKYFNSSVELVILDKEDIYSKQQAEQILKNHFEKNQVKNFTLLHQGGKESAKYAICNLETVNGKTYRVYLLVKESGGNPLIHQMRIEEE